MLKKGVWGGIVLIGVLAGMAIVAVAQNEGSLRDALVDRYVVVEMDMPAHKDGVDIYVNKPQKLKHKEIDQRVRRYGAAFYRGEAVQISDVRVKKKYIEIFLEGGGYGVKGDEKKRNFYAGRVPMSDEEENLRDELAYIDKTMPQTRMLVEERIAYLEAEREAEYQRRVEEAERREAEQHGRVEEARLHAGSRFNIRFGKKVPADALTPEGLIAILDGYADFSPEAVEAGLQKREQRENDERADASE